MKHRVCCTAWIILLVSVFVISGCGRNGQNSEAEARPEATLYNTQWASTSLGMVFDLQGSGALCDKPQEVVTLESPSESVNPSTGFFQGDFFTSDDKNATVFGNIKYVDVLSDGEKWTIIAFKRIGAGEKWLGSQGGNIFVADEENGVKIGEVQYMDVTTPEGEKRTELAHRLSGSDGKWIVNLGGRIYRIEDGGALTQVGWVDWRKIITKQDGEPLAILMTKGMDAKSVWAGRFAGILYKDKK